MLQRLRSVIWVNIFNRITGRWGRAVDCERRCTAKVDGAAGWHFPTVSSPSQVQCSSHSISSAWGCPAPPEGKRGAASDSTTGGNKHQGCRDRGARTEKPLCTPYKTLKCSPCNKELLTAAAEGAELQGLICWCGDARLQSQEASAAVDSGCSGRACLKGGWASGHRRLGTNEQL